MSEQIAIVKNDQVVGYNYDRKGITTGIVHIGVGNFHRAHQQFYTNLLLEHAEQSKWGICGVALLPQDEKLVKALQSQGGEYTLTVCGRDGKDQAYQIGSLTELIWGFEDPKRVVSKIASPEIKIITLTITEGGYRIDGVTGKFAIENAEIQHDIQNPATPKTVFGFVAEGLRQRMQNGTGGLTILSCDNLQHNGNTAKKAFTSFIEAQDQALAAWVADNVTFPNSMVDRITPGTKPEDIDWLNNKNGTNDQAPVYCEDFIQWVVEDNFIAGRPAWELVGVEFTNDVTLYENMKLSLLNASHTLLSYPSFLAGYRKVDEAMGNVSITRLVRDFMDIDVTPYVPAPENTDLDLYKATLIERFANHTVSDQVSRLCFDGMSKFPVYIIPNLTKMVKDEKDLTRVAYLIASYRHYLKYAKDDNGQSFEVAEPWLTENDRQFVMAENPLGFLDFKPFNGCPLASSEAFVKLYINFCEEIEKQGALAVLKTIV